MAELVVPQHGVLTTRTERIWLGEDGIIRAVIHPGLETSLADAQENVRGFASVAGGVKRRALIDMRAHASSATREAREYYAGPENAKVVTAVALLVRSSISRMMGNFFLGLNKTIFPLRLFAEPEPALEWLRGLERGEGG
ncbi:MAG: STAS/SEC14 domain-containing protein [Nannocystis sp.]|nr:STAS/SEC14 domain-containing protein [Nannocystis sp.]